MAPTAGAVSPEDREKIVATATDYVQSWIHGDADRMARCLHPDLAKRSLRPDPESEGCLVRNLTRDDMVAATATGEGAADAGPYEVSILTAYDGIATVEVLSSSYVDYLHIARCGEDWPIINVLWQRRAER